jgi:DNA-binding transcriptional regulator YhcF (GntR family)
VTIDRHDDRALYLQPADILRRDIVDGRLAPGDKLPSESELIEQHGISRGTAREAITALRTEGIIVVEHGRGAYVSHVDALLHTRVTSTSDTPLRLREAFERDVTAQGRTATTRTIDAAIIISGSYLAPPNGLIGPEGLLFFVDGRPVQVAASGLQEHGAEARNAPSLSRSPPECQPDRFADSSKSKTAHPSCTQPGRSLTGQSRSNTPSPSRQPTAKSSATTSHDSPRHDTRKTTSTSRAAYRTQHRLPPWLSPAVRRPICRRRAWMIGGSPTPAISGQRGVPAH